MISRSEKGNLRISKLEMMGVFEELFEACNSEEETEFLRNELIGYIELAEEERNEELF